jgi:hypothetical protein
MKNEQTNLSISLILKEIVETYTPGIALKSAVFLPKTARFPPKLNRLNPAAR